MIYWSEIVAEITSITGATFEMKQCSAIGGGCINEAYCIASDNQKFFIKLNAADRLSMFEAEAAGLKEISRSQTLRVPMPICCGSNKSHAWLVLEYLDFNQSSKHNAAELGRGLAAMHRICAKQYGWQRDNTIGDTPQINNQTSDWVEFWRINRLGYQFQLARSNGYTGQLQKLGEQLMEKTDMFFSNDMPAAALLHGDLWRGNCSYVASGQPVLFDPAVYYGDRETDIAMTELFGEFPESFYAAYQESFPLNPGYKTRKTLYNLYHILNHLNLFGSSYLRQSEQMASSLLAQVR